MFVAAQSTQAVIVRLQNYNDVGPSHLVRVERSAPQQGANFETFLSHRLRRIERLEGAAIMDGAKLEGRVNFVYSLPAMTIGNVSFSVSPPVMKAGGQVSRSDPYYDANDIRGLRERIAEAGFVVFAGLAILGGVRKLERLWGQKHPLVKSHSMG
jgi:hypothetical protein